MQIEEPISNKTATRLCIKSTQLKYKTQKATYHEGAPWTKCLKIDDKWVGLILSGQKTWEIRRANTKIREKVALGNTKTKNYVGYAKIIDSIEMTLEELKKHNEKHQANDFLEKYAGERKTLFAWVLDSVEVEANPRPYSFSTGSWCKI